MKRNKYRNNWEGQTPLSRAFLLVNIGSEDRPASDEDVKKARKVFKKFLKGSGVNAVVGHHALTVSAVRMD
jgi:hypothetical protein